MTTTSTHGSAAYLALSEQLRRHRRRALAVDVLAGALRRIDQPEEEVGGDLLDALCSMIRSGRIHCDTASIDRNHIRIGSDSVLTMFQLQ